MQHRILNRCHWLINMAVCLAVIGKDNSLKYIQCSRPEAELHFQYKIHMSLDIVDEKLSHFSTLDDRKLYLGLLHSTEDHKIYGYATTTKVKFIIVIDASNVVIKDADIQGMFRKLHATYIDIVSNPFYIPGEPLTSKKITNVANSILSSQS